MTVVIANVPWQVDTSDMTKIPLHPKNPERVCWGCDKYCPATDLACGNGTIRTMHPVELFGDDWLEWSDEHSSASQTPSPTEAMPTTSKDR